MSKAARPRNICILCTQHRKDDPRVARKIAAFFVAAGHRVTWFGRDAGGAATPGVDFRGIKAGGSKLARLLRGWVLFRDCRRWTDLASVDVFFAVEPDSALVALLLARGTAARVAFDIHEMYHREMLDRWVPRLLRGFVGGLVWAGLAGICRGVDLALAPGDSRLKPYARFIRRSLVVRHCLPVAMVASHCATPFQRADGVVRLMHGKIGPERGAVVVIRALGELRRTSTAAGRIRLVCYGDPRGRAAEWASFRNLIESEKVADLIELRPEVSFEQAMKDLTECDAGIIAYGRLYGVHCLPNRLYEYMAVGLPVLVPAYAEEIGGLVEHHDCGWRVDMEDALALAKALGELLAQPAVAQACGARARATSLKQINMEREIGPLMRWISEGKRGEEGAA